MDFFVLKSFLKLLETENFSEAAEQLNMTQPTLSQQISKLERELGIKLINRTTRSFSITDAGIAFSNHARKLVEQEAIMLDDMQQYKSTSKHTLRIGVVPTLGKIHLMKYVLTFKDEFPDVDIELHENYSESLYKMLAKKNLDIALANSLGDQSPVKGVRFFEKTLIAGRLVMVCGSNHRFANYPSITLKEAAEEPIIKLPAHASVSILANKYFRKYELKQKIACFCENTSNMIALVDSNYGISFLSERIAENYITDKTRIVKITPKIRNDLLVVSRYETANEKLVSAFISHMVNAVEDLRKKLI